MKTQSDGEPRNHDCSQPSEDIAGLSASHAGDWNELLELMSDVCLVACYGCGPRDRSTGSVRDALLCDLDTRLADEAYRDRVVSASGRLSMLRSLDSARGRRRPVDWKAILDVAEPGVLSSSDRLQLFNSLKLNAEHLEHLKSTSGLTEKTVAGAQFKSVAASQAVKFGFPERAGLLMPYPGVPDYYRLRPDTPLVRKDGSSAKYLTRAGEKNHLYVPPSLTSVLTDPTRRLIITEGEKKALKATQEGFHTVALPGVWGWKTDGDLLPEMQRIVWSDRPTYICYDSDIVSKLPVLQAMRRLARRLEDAGAVVRVVLLPGGDTGKVGLDDYLLDHGQADFQLLLDNAPTVLDAVIRLIPGGLDSAALEKFMSEVYRTAHAYPTSLMDAARAIKDKLIAQGYSSPSEEQIVKLVKAASDDDDVAAMEALRAAQAILKEQYTHDDLLSLRYHRGRFHEWTGECYKEIRDEDMSPLVTRWLQNHGGQTNQGYVSNVLGNLAALTLLRTSLPVPFRILDVKSDGKAIVSAENLVGFQNGILNLDKLLTAQIQVEPHSPLWFSRTVLPYSFERDAKCYGWMGFLAEVLNYDREMMLLVQEMFGYCLSGNMRYQKFFILQGEGSNGKSVVLDVLQAMLGDENVSSIPLDRFGDRFTLAEMEGKLANIYADLEEINKFDEGMLKSLTSGDPIQIERKYKDPYTMHPSAKVIFSTNTLPHIRDRSQGIWRRLVVVPFNVVIPEEEQDKQLPAKLKKELPGIFNWAVQGLKALNTRGRFIDPVPCTQIRDEYRLTTDPVAMFLEEAVTDSPGSSILCTQLYGKYRQWAHDNGHVPLSNVNFGRQLTRLKPTSKRKTAKDEARKTIHVYPNMAWRA